MQPIEPMFNVYQGQLKLSKAWPRDNLGRPASAASSSWRTPTASVCSPSPRATSPSWACGYSTIYGDAVGGYAPIKDLLKTRVWELSRWRNRAAAAGVGIGGLRIVGNENGDAAERRCPAA